MTTDEFISAIVYTMFVMLILVIGRMVYNLVRPQLNLKSELVKKDNLAVALVTCGYQVGLTLALGGIIMGESVSLVDDLIDLSVFGVLAIILLNISGFINDKVVFHKFSNIKELVTDQNVGLGAVEAGFFIGSGLVFVWSNDW